MILIEFDNPRAIYYPGQPVTGNVTLTLKDKVKAHSLMIAAIGQAHTHWSESRTRSTTDSHGRTVSESYTVTFSDTVLYFKGEAVPWSSTASCNKLDKGVHKYPFLFMLPPYCPPSFEGCLGYIRYEIFVEIDRVWKFNKNNRQFFSVIPHLDLNAIPRASLPIQNSTIAKTGIVLFRSGKIGMQVRIPKSGFVPGETIQVEALVDNASSRPITQGTLKLFQDSKYYASSSNPVIVYNPGEVYVPGCHHSTREDHKCVISALEAVRINPRTKQTVLFNLVVPAVVPTLNTCPIIHVEYSLKIAFHSTASLNNKMATCDTIIIGTVPIQQNFVNVTTTVASAPPMPYPSSNGVYPSPNPQSNTAYPSPNPPPIGMYPASNPPGYETSAAYPSAPSGAIAPPSMPQPGQFIPPPSYGESVFGADGTMKDTNNSQAFAPVYPYYTNLPLENSNHANAPPYPEPQVSTEPPTPKPRLKMMEK